MSYSLNKIAESVLKLSSIFLNLSFKKFADEESEEKDKSRRKIVDQSKSGVKSREEAASTILGEGKGRAKKAPAEKKSFDELKLIQIEMMDSDAEKLKDLNQAQFEEMYDLTERVVNILANKYIQFSKDNPGALLPKKIKEKKALRSCLLLFSELKTIYPFIISDKTGIGNLFKVFKENGFGEGFKNSIDLDDLASDVRSMVSTVYTQLQLVNGANVARPSIAKTILQALKEQGYNTDEDQKINNKINILTNLRPEAFIEKISPNRAKDEESIKKEQQKFERKISRLVEDERSEVDQEFDQWIPIAEQFAALEFVGGEEGGKALEAGVRTLQRSFAEITRTLIERNNERISSTKDQIEKLSASGADPKSIEFQQRKLKQLETRATANLEFRERISNKMDVLLDQLSNLDEESLKQQLEQLKELIRSIALQQANALAIARYYDFIDPMKIRGNVRVDESKINNLLNIIDPGYLTTQESDVRKLIENLRNKYIECKSSPARFVGEAASDFKREFPKWLERIQSGKLSEWLVTAQNLNYLPLDENEKAEIANIIIKLNGNQQIDTETFKKYVNIIFNFNATYFEQKAFQMQSAFEVNEENRTSIEARRANLRALRRDLVAAEGKDEDKVAEIKSKLQDFIALDYNLTPYMLQEAQELLNRSAPSVGAEANEEDLLQAIKDAVNTCSTNVAFITEKQRPILKAIGRYLQSGPDKEKIKKLFEFLISKIDRDVFEKLKREIFVEIYLTSIGKRELKDIYETDKEGFKKMEEIHQEGMKKLISTQFEYIKEQASYAAFNIARKVDRDMGEVLTSISRINESELRGIIPDLAPSILDYGVRNQINEQIKIVKAILTKGKLKLEAGQFDAAMNKIIELYNTNNLYTQKNTYIDSLYKAISLFKQLRNLSIEIRPPEEGGASILQRIQRQRSEVSEAPTSKEESRESVTRPKATQAVRKFTPPELRERWIAKFLTFINSKMNTSSSEELSKFNVILNKMIENLSTDVTLESLEANRSNFNEIVLKEIDLFIKSATDQSSNQQAAIEEFNKWRVPAGNLCKQMQSNIAKRL